MEYQNNTGAGLKPGDTVYLVSPIRVRPHTVTGYRIKDEKVSVVIRIELAGAVILREIALEDRDKTWFTDPELAQRTFESQKV